MVFRSIQWHPSAAGNHWLWWNVCKMGKGTCTRKDDIYPNLLFQAEYLDEHLPCMHARITSSKGADMFLQHPSLQYGTTHFENVINGTDFYVSSNISCICRWFNNKLGPVSPCFSAFLFFNMQAKETPTRTKHIVFEKSGTSHYNLSLAYIQWIIKCKLTPGINLISI